MRRCGRAALSVLAVSGLLIADRASAQEAMPSFETVVTSPAPGADVWYTDRYAPAAFENVGTFQGRDDVLGVGISEADHQDDSFYNYQGRKYDTPITGDFTISADLWLDASWADGSSGFRAPSLWATAVDGTGAISAYPILGFSNTSGSGLFRAYDPAGFWLDLAATPDYGAWNSLQISFDSGTSMFSYYVNGAQQAMMDGGTTAGLSNVMVQAYNFGEDHTVHWANAESTQVPEPSFLLLMAPGLIGIAAVRRRRSANEIG